MSQVRPTTAFVLGAGLGTRLRPLTNRRPKPLIPVGGRPLITHAFDHLLTIGVERFVVNTHWCAERYAEFFPDAQWRGRPITFMHESPEVLETAGGIWHAREHLQNGPFVVYNGDILSDVPLLPAWERHVAGKAEVTIVLRSEGENRNVTFDPATGEVLDLRRALRPDLEPAHLFTGIYFVEPQFIERIPAGEKISVVPIFHAMIRAGIPVAGALVDEGDWRDLGTRAEYLAACAALGQPQWISPHAKVAPDAVLEDCLVWENAEVAASSRLTRCVVTDGARAKGTHENCDFAKNDGQPAAGRHP
jgi:NDP-sugar pyrophosphorylase family protein